MPWVRIDDHFPDHPKVVSAGPIAAWLFVAGLCYCNRFLTNGFIPINQIDRLVPLDERRDVSESPQQLTKRLVSLALWTETTKKGVRGVLVHDYLKYQVSKAQVLTSRAHTAVRQGRFRHARNNGKSNAVTNEEPNGIVTAAPIPTPIPTKKEDVRPAGANGRSKRPIFSGQRIVVFDWMLEDIRQILGPYTDDFALDEWFYTLDSKAVRLDLVIPKRDNGAWIQAQLLEEASRRGLKIAGAEEDPYAKLPTAWQCKQCGEVHEGTQDQGRKRACLKGAS